MDNKKFQELVLQQLNMLTTDIKGIKSTVSKLEVDTENLTTDMKDIKSTVSKLEVDTENLTTDMKDIKSTVSKLEVDIENKVIEKIRALFDDREVQNERLDRIEDKLDKISTDTSYLVARVARLENLAKQP